MRLLTTNDHYCAQYELNQTVPNHSLFKELVCSTYSINKKGRKICNKYH